MSIFKGKGTKKKVKKNLEKDYFLGFLPVTLLKQKFRKDLMSVDSLGGDYSGPLLEVKLP